MNTNRNQSMLAPPQKSKTKDQRQELLNRVAELRALLSDARQRAKDGGKTFDEQVELQENLGVAIRQLERFESKIVTDDAMKWGVEIPNNPDWWEDDRHIFAGQEIPEDIIDSLASRWLNLIGRSVINKRVEDAKFDYLKKRVELLIPILSFVLAILALLKGRVW